MPVKLSNQAHAQKMRVWRHNSFLGAASMARNSMLNIARADSTTPAAQELAERIAQDCDRLTVLLKERID